MNDKKRKMPHSNDAKTNGKFDVGKFTSLQGQAKEAIDSGETAIRSIHIENDKNGKLVVRTKRQHGHGKAGIDPKIVAKLQDVLTSSVQEGLIKIADVTEGDVGNDHDEFVVQAA